MSDKKTVIALGYFDSVHKGHRRVMQKARELAEKLNSNLAVFTFKGNLKKAVLGEDEKCVYTASERESIIKELGVNEVFFAPVTKEFLSLDRQAFLDFLNEKYNVVCYVSGEDYKFGFKGKGGKEFLASYAKNHAQEYVVCATENYLNEKISTTRIKDCLRRGNIKEANAMLGKNYSVTGKVFEDRKVGRKLGFPTVNIALDKDKLELKGGVYRGSVVLDKKEYKAIINYGARPTYGLDAKLIEAHIVDFNGDLYGKEITIFFESFMRDIKRFNCEQELANQLKDDLKAVKEIL